MVMKIKLVVVVARSFAVSKLIEATINPRTFKQIHTHMVVQAEGGGGGGGGGEGDKFFQFAVNLLGFNLCEKMFNRDFVQNPYLPRVKISYRTIP